jgi:hypothetical protein
VAEEKKWRRMDEQLILEETEEELLVGPGRDERAKVESWRLHVLIEAGYPLPLAERLAQSQSDLHEAVSLVTSRGCSPEVAAQILL